MNSTLLPAVKWGVGLWLFGYLLGFLFFGFVPAAQIGWFVTPFGIAATCWVLWARLRPESPGQGALIGTIWTLIAVALDFVFIVKLLSPRDGYYKLDVGLYYALTLALPVLFAMRSGRRSQRVAR